MFSTIEILIYTKNVSNVIKSNFQETIKSNHLWYVAVWMSWQTRECGRSEEWPSIMLYQMSVSLSSRILEIAIHKVSSVSSLSQARTWYPWHSTLPEHSTSTCHILHMCPLASVSVLCVLLGENDTCTMVDKHFINIHYSKKKTSVGFTLNFSVLCLIS